MANFYTKVTLKNCSALMLLLVFALSITPKNTLHSWFANHKDNTSFIPDGKTQQITKAGYNCNCEDLVAESPFYYAGETGTISMLTFFSVSFPEPHFSLSFSSVDYNLRGPPFKILIA